MLFFIFLFLFPFVFAPDIGISMATPYGFFDTSDFVIPVLYFLLLPGILRRSGKLLPKRLSSLYLFFIFWATASTMLIAFKYSSMAGVKHQIIYGLLKLGKFFEYSFFMYMLARSLNNKNRIMYFTISFAVGCAVLSISSLNWAVTSLEPDVYTTPKYYYIYRANVTSVAFGGMICFWAGHFLKKRWSISWNFLLAFLGLMMAAIFITHGRGGWIAMACGLFYIQVKMKPDLSFLNWRKTAIIFLSVIIFIFLFNHFASLRKSTLNVIMSGQSDGEIEPGPSSKYGIYDANRISIFLLNIDKLSNSPIFGAGFFNRTSESRLAFSGSHNFFLQMALETGIVGMLTIIAILYTLWKASRLKENNNKNNAYTFAFRASFIAFIVGCLSGEYLYGGPALLVLSCITAIFLAEQKVLIDFDYPERTLYMKNNDNMFILRHDKPL